VLPGKSQTNLHQQKSSLFLGRTKYPDVAGLTVSLGWILESSGANQLARGHADEECSKEFLTLVITVKKGIRFYAVEWSFPTVHWHWTEDSDYLPLPVGNGIH
jgi:hypothetical protein